MRRRAWLLPLALALLAGCAGAPAAETQPAATAPPPAAAPAERVLLAEGTIAAGGPHTRVRSLAVIGWERGVEATNGSDAFLFALPPGTTAVHTETTDGGGLGHDVDVYFRDADGAYIADGACATSAADESCEVPEGAAMGTVDAARGVRLTVRLFAGLRG